VADCFLVEVYTPDGADAFPDAIERVRAAAGAMTDEGVPMRYRRALLVHGDDACFHVIQAPSTEAVIEATRRAGLEFERIVEVVDMPCSTEDEVDADHPSLLERTGAR
jgi:hypothetical protein